jgi:hypothetical protein
MYSFSQDNILAEIVTVSYPIALRVTSLIGVFIPETKLERPKIIHAGRAWIIN